MMPDFRALCAELVDELEDWIAYGDVLDCADAHAVVDRARAALVQPELQGPTMADLSPAAQAVLDALYMEELNGPQQLMARAHAAAALRAAAQFNPGPFVPELFDEGWKAAMTELEYIADQLEAQ